MPTIYKIVLAVARKRRIKGAGNMRIPSRQKKRTPGITLHLFLVAALLFLWGITTVGAKPRPLSPPWPSFGLLAREGFDQPLGFSTNQMIDSAVWLESWSAYSLNRQGTTVTPWVMPMVVSNVFRLEPERGAYRLWYRPDYSSGMGAGQPATLLTLATVKDKTELVWWSLVVSASGNEIHLVCETANGPQSCLQAEVNWEAGSWNLLTLGFTPTNCALFIGDQLKAVGEGLPTIPSELTSYTSLSVGSSLEGGLPAQGQIEELAIFSGRKKMQQVMGNIFGLSVDWEIGIYFTSLSKTAALGPISDEEIAARKAAAEKRKAERAALGLEEEGGGGMMRLMSGPIATCETNSPLFITNTACFYDTNAGWTLQFDVQGTNGPADIFTIATLGTTNAWTWLERGPSCSRFEYTNMPPQQSYVILGTMQDSDNDGLTDAYEKLVSKTLINNPDTDGDGISDRDEVLLGTNPLVNEIALSSGRLNYQYNANGWLTNASGIWSKGIGLDAEGNVSGVTP